MKPTSYLINTSRGPLIDEDALVEALRTESIAGAALDVFDVEPLGPSHPLLTLVNVILSPPAAGFTRDTYRIWYEGAVEAILAYIEGRTIPVRHDRSFR